MSSVKTAKRALRKAMAAKLSKLSAQEVARQSLLVTQRVSETTPFQKARTVALYMNMPTEIDTMLLISHCFDQHKTVFLPSCSDESGAHSTTMRFLQVQSFDKVQQLQPRGKYRLREALLGADVMQNGGLDLIIVPGVAFSTEGHRLGHGAGYYDNFISSYQTKFGTRPFLLGIGIAEQRVDDVPTESHDWVLDAVVFGDGVLGHNSEGR